MWRCVPPTLTPRLPSSFIPIPPEWKWTDWCPATPYHCAAVLLQLVASVMPNSQINQSDPCCAHWSLSLTPVSEINHPWFKAALGKGGTKVLELQINTNFEVFFFPTVWPTKQASIFYVVICHHSSFVLGYCTVSVTISTSFLRHIVHESIYFMSFFDVCFKKGWWSWTVMVYLRKDCILREEYDTILNRICPYCTVALSFLVPNTHVCLVVRTCLRLHFVAREEQSSVMKTCWQDKNCLSPTCDLCFWMCVAASSRWTEAVEHTPEAAGPAPEHRGLSYLSLSVNNNSSQRPFRAIPGLFLTSFQDLKDKANLRKAMRKKV